ncbi:MAG: FkbM family methyltransferase [Synergistaceae bacterium]|nr:FkbM family methyltransferase [Synergistaceae bacterium]
MDIASPSYIDVGAHHPFLISNTALFYKRGSRGINIEPNPVLFKKIAQVRKDDINIMTGIGTAKGTMPFYVMDAAALSTFSKTAADECCSKYGHKIVNVIQVQIDTLSNVINEYCGGVFPDFMSLDTEGLDEIILGSLKECPSLPKVICTETWDYGLKTHHIPAICGILEPLGYMMLIDNHLNSIFVMRSLWEKALSDKKKQ